VAERFIGSKEPLVLTVPFSVDVELFRPAVNRDLTRRAVAEEIGIPADGPWLLVVAGFVRRKNHHLAIRFMHALQQRIPEVRLIMVGATPNRPSSMAFRAAVEDLANSCGVGNRVHFLGHLPQSRLSLLMATADLLVHFTNCRLENFGLVVAEAMAAGLPVVAADWGGLRDLVEPGRTGLLARTYLTRWGPRTDWQSIVRPACDLLRNRSAWRGFSRQAESYAKQHLSDVSFRSRFGTAVTTALARRIRQDGSPVFTSAGTDLRIRTIGLNALHPEIRDTGDEYRLLMRKDEGRHYRLLTGPAASSESPPAVGPHTCLYPLVAYNEDAAEIRIEDPAWPATIAADPIKLAILRSSNGKTTLDEVWRTKTAPTTTADVWRIAAQEMVDEGLLCPLEDSYASTE
jgi:hypothetical protein